MSAKGRTFDAARCLAEARAGKLSAAQVRKAIAQAEQFGNVPVAKELALYVVSATAFAGDEAPQEVRDRVARGVSVLIDRGEPLSRTRQMFKRHGVVETLNRIARYPAASKNFDTLCNAGFVHLTAEAIVLDFPKLFSQAAVQVAQRRLAEFHARSGNGPQLASDE